MCLVKELQGLSLKVDLISSDKLIDAEAILAVTLKKKQRINGSRCSRAGGFRY